MSGQRCGMRGSRRQDKQREYSLVVVELTFDLIGAHTVEVFGHRDFAIQETHSAHGPELAMQIMISASTGVTLLD